MMSSLHFYKYQGTANDFILIDNQKGKVELSSEEIATLCHRRFGIGADGLMLLECKEGFDFYMRYYNSDGAESSMCGNGGRCITAFARHLGIIGLEARFLAIDGPHESRILEDNRVSLSMQDVPDIFFREDVAILDTGSPHFICWREDVRTVNVLQEGRTIRNFPQFAPGGINVNFVQRSGDTLTMRTYERGVEDETWSCGTGATAAAIAASGMETGFFSYRIETLGGPLEVSFRKAAANKAIEVKLTGPAIQVYEGNI